MKCMVFLLAMVACTIANTPDVSLGTVLHNIAYQKAAAANGVTFIPDVYKNTFYVPPDSRYLVRSPPHSYFDNPPDSRYLVLSPPNYHYDNYYTPHNRGVAVNHDDNPPDSLYQVRSLPNSYYENYYTPHNRGVANNPDDIPPDLRNLVRSSPHNHYTPNNRGVAVFPADTPEVTAAKIDHLWRLYIAHRELYSKT